MLAAENGDIELFTYLFSCDPIQEQDDLISNNFVLSPKNSNKEQSRLDYLKATDCVSILK